MSEDSALISLPADGSDATTAQPLDPPSEPPVSPTTTVAGGELDAAPAAGASAPVDATRPAAVPVDTQGRTYLGLRRLEVAALVGVLAFYLAMRFIGLTSFPIYFFCDEAIHAVLAEQFIEEGYRDAEGTRMPSFFKNDLRWNLSLSVYMHVASLGLFGKSIFITRATNVVISLIAALAMCEILRRIFNLRLWWLGALALSAIPAWFLHTRTAFETVMMVAFYGGFLASYLRYRYGEPRMLFAAVLFGAATFYSYANGQVLIAVSVVLLLLSDLLYHLRQLRQNWTVMVGALLLAIICVLPYFRFQKLHPEAMRENLSLVNSYWVQQIPQEEKLAIFRTQYLAGLDPNYWFKPEHQDQIRHVMKDMGRAPLIFLPFTVLGIGICLWRWRSSAHRAILIAVLASPVSAALAEIGITRVLAMVIPIAILTVLGLDQLATWLERWGWMPFKTAAVICGVVLALMNVSMLRASLEEGPLWFSDYAGGGYQWGAPQVFGAAREELALKPDTVVAMSPNWANGPDAFLHFFLEDHEKQRFTFNHSVHSFLNAKTPIDPNLLFIFPPDEYELARSAPKLVVSEPERIIPYPDGRPGFYFVRMRYVDNIEEIRAAERAERARPIEAMIGLDGQDVLVRHSLLDNGSLQDLVDGNTDTLMRGYEANPLLIEFNFPSPRTISGLDLTVALNNFQVTLTMTRTDGTQEVHVLPDFRDMPNDPTVSIDLPGGPAELSAIRLNILDLYGVPDDTHIHVRELKFR